MRRSNGLLLVGLALALAQSLAGQNEPQAGSGQGGVERLRKAEQSAVLILVGDGGGRVQSVHAGVITRSDGIILTAYRPFRDSQEVQVRLNDGEVYDQVDLIAFDARRDVAALRIPATGLASLAAGGLRESTPGEKIYVLAPNAGMAWMVSEGVLGSVRLADELLGAGQGFRVIQFMAPVPVGTLGGALLNSKGEILGFLPGSLSQGGPQFAVPLESVAGLSAQGSRTALGSGKNLQLPKIIPNQVGASLNDSNPMAALAGGRTVRVTSRTSFLTPFMLETELLNNSEFRGLGMNVLRDSRGGDLVVEVDRPLFTYDFTYSVADSHSSRIVVTGKVTAIDGPNASKGIAKRIVQELERARTWQAAQLSQP